MIDFTTAGVHRFWYEYDHRILYRVICLLESVEPWTVDQDPEVDAALQKFIEGFEKNTSLELKDKDMLIKFLVALKSGKAFRFMHLLDSIQPGAAAQLLTHAETQSKEADDEEMRPFYDIFLKRNLSFERLQLIGRIFSSERIDLVLKALEETDD